MPRTAGAILGSALIAVALVGCASAPATGAAPADTSPPVVSPEETPSPIQGPFTTDDCVVAPATVLEAVDQIIVDKANSLPAAHAFFDKEHEYWIISGAFAGPASEGEGLMGHWATQGDIAKDPFVGEFWALDGGAQELSTAPRSDSYNHDLIAATREFPSSTECNGVLVEGSGK